MIAWMHSRRRLMAGLVAASFLPLVTTAEIVYEPYTFTTLAGAVESGPGSIDGSGGLVRFNAPGGAVVDGSGNLFLADVNNHTIRRISPGGVVSTVAGLAGKEGSLDGAGAAARFSFPQDVALDSQGNLLVADTFNHTIRRITPAGVVSTIAGSAGNSGTADGRGAAARFNYPLAVAIDRDGSIYVADSQSHTIRKIAPDGLVATLAGLPGTFDRVDGTGSAARFRVPQDLVVDDAGIIYVADGGNHAVRKISPGGVVTTLAGGSLGSANGTGSSAQFQLPCGIALGSGGTLFIADTQNQTIRQVTSAGVVTTVAGAVGTVGAADGTGNAARFYYPLGLAVGPGDTIYVLDTYNHTLRKITSAGVVTTLAGAATAPGTVDGRGSVARFNYPQDIAADSSGNLYVADGMNHTIRKITSGGIVSTFAGVAGNPGSSDGSGSGARFREPLGLAVDAAGTVYVADSANHTIRKISPSGAVTTFAGRADRAGSVDATGGSARFNKPFRVAVDRLGIVYVADTWNHIIRKITPTGVVTTFAGNPGQPGSADGVGTAASFYYPEGIAVDDAGNVFVADDGNHTIRKISPAGLVSTFAGAPGQAGTTDGLGSTARFNYPYGLAVDGDRNVYLTDGSHSLRKITPAGAVTTLAGTPEIAGSSDGPGPAAQFNSPAGITLDSHGIVYLVDAASHSIRKGFAPLPDRPVVNPPVAPAGTLRQFDVANLTTKTWAWSIIRQPASGSALLSAPNTQTPTLTPDVDDLYVLRFFGWDGSGRVAIENISVSSESTLLRLVIGPGSAPGTVGISLQAPAGTSGRVEASANLSTWAPLADFLVTDPAQPWRHADGLGLQHRFYRAIVP